MVIRNYHWLNLASRVLISTCSAPLVQTGKRKQFSLFDLDLMPKITFKGQTVQTGVCPQTDRHTHTHGCYQTYYLPCYAVDKNNIAYNKQIYDTIVTRSSSSVKTSSKKLSKYSCASMSLISEYNIQHKTSDSRFY